MSVSKFLSSELTARAVDITSHFPSDRNVNVSFFQSVLKTFHKDTLRSLKFTFFDRIHRNQVDMGAKRRGQFRKGVRFPFAVVDASDQRIFKCNPSSGPFKIIRAC